MSAPSGRQADLPHKCHQVVEEVFLDNLPIVPAGYRTELNVKRFAGGRNLLAVRSLHRPLHRPSEPRDRAGPVAGGKEDAVRSVAKVLVGKGLEEPDRFGPVIVDAMGWGLSRPADHDIRLVALGKRVEVLGVPGIVQGLHQFYVPFFCSHHPWLLPVEDNPCRIDTTPIRASASTLPMARRKAGYRACGRAETALSLRKKHSATVYP